MPEAKLFFMNNIGIDNQFKIGKSGHGSQYLLRTKQVFYHLSQVDGKCM